MLSRLSEERGVAAMTAMLVVAVLAVAGGTLIFSTLSELDQGSRDRRAESAFAAAEGGLDVAADHLFEDYTWDASQQTAGAVCLDNPLTVGPPIPAPLGTPCTAGEEVIITSPSNGRWVVGGGGRPFIIYNVFSQARGGKTVTRALMARYRVTLANIPLAMVVDGNVDLNGTPKMYRESLLVNGTVTSRTNLTFDWNGNGLFDDPDLGWVFHKDLIKSDPEPDICGIDAQGQPVGCAAVYSNFLIFAKQQGASVDPTQPNSDEIHYDPADPLVGIPPSQSAFPRDRDSHQQAQDPQTGLEVNVVTIPINELLEPMDSLRSVAQGQQLYFDYRNGRGEVVQFQPQDVGATSRTFPDNVVVYIEADASDTIGWKVNLIPESTASDLKTSSGVGPDSGVIVVRGGSLRLEAGTQWSGAIFVPENTLRILGNVVFTGTIYAAGFTAQGGNSTITLTPEWFERMPAGFAQVTRTLFAECERYQPSAICPATT